MDNVHHALIVGAGFAAAAHLDAPLAGAAFVAGSVFPDLDVLLMAFGKRFYLRHHQGISHSLPLSPLYALLIAAPLWALESLGNDSAVWIFLAALAGLWLHTGLDLLNTFRIALFSPFSAKRYSLDALFFIDAPALLLTAAFYTGYYGFDIEAALLLYPLLFASYLMGRLWLRRSLGRRLTAEAIIPTSFNPLAFYTLNGREDGGANSVLYNAASGAQSRPRDYPPVMPEQQAMAEASEVFRDMRGITRALRIVEVAASGDGTTLVAEDTAVRNFGGRFGRTRLRFDNNGRLVDEVADI